MSEITTLSTSSSLPAVRALRNFLEVTFPEINEKAPMLITVDEKDQYCLGMMDQTIFGRGDEADKWREWKSRVTLAVLSFTEGYRQGQQAAVNQVATRLEVGKKSIPASEHRGVSADEFG